MRLNRKVVLIGMLTLVISVSYSLLDSLLEPIFKQYINASFGDWKTKSVTMLILAGIVVLGYTLIENLHSKSSTTTADWSGEKEAYKKRIEQLEQDKEILQKRTKQLEETNKQLKELQDLFYVLVRHGRVSVSDITRKWEEKYGKDSAFIVYEKGKGFNLKRRDSSKKKYLLETLPKRYGIELSDESKSTIWKHLQGVLVNKSPFSEFLEKEYGMFSAPLFKSSPPEPFHLIVFPKELRISTKDLARVFQEEYLKYASKLKKKLKAELNRIMLNLPNGQEKEVIQAIIKDFEQWNPSEGILIILPFSSAEIPFGKFSEEALSLLEKYHPNSLETIKEELTKTILKNLTLSAFLEYAKLPFHKIKELEEHEDEIKAKLGIKRWGELFNVDPRLIQNVFSQYNVTEEELNQILNAVEKITEIIERPDRIIRR
ncbi:MAG TPA: hypothetical protein ENL40_07740 [Thermococcus litoralis]|uniref:Uncharacterized protein n=1 Tax=Thermococcus litoralis TaxID=2265 RepID=A0A7C5PB43_THELI|nr:hypothetical protein [Thermococcus litoralis]